MPRRPFALLAVMASVGATALLLDPAVAHAAEGGLQIIPEPWRLVALLALFVVLVPLLDRLLFQPLLRVLDERERRIDGARARATELAQQAATLVARHDDAIRKARETAHADQLRVIEDARGRQQSTVGEARHAAEGEITAARGEIARVVESVRASLRADAEPIAREIASRLLGRSAS